MPERKYSVSEIDQMRNSLQLSYSSGFSYSPQERSAEIENRLRTYMTNGTDPEELQAIAMQRFASEQNARQQWQDAHQQAPEPQAKIFADSKSWTG